MARINTNVGAYIANTNLQRNQQALNTSLERLSSGLRINTGADDPAGLIASEGLQSQMAGLTQAINNSTQASNVITTADGALSEVSNLLLSIQSLVVQGSNTGAFSSDEIQANQLQIDSAVASITRIANSTSFAGLHLLDGSLGYVTSGIATSALHDVAIQSVAFGTAATIPVTVNVMTSAQQAALFYRQSALTSDVSLEISGSGGVQELSFVAGTKASAVAFGINRVSDSTGVTATMVSATNASSGISFNSSGYGSQQFVSVTVVGDSGSFNTTNTAGSAQQRSYGQDAVASINGAQAIGNGLEISLATPALTLSLNLDANFGTGTRTFTINGGGANFQLGAQVQSNQQASIAIGSVAASRLGNAQDGYLSDLVTGGSAALTTGNGAQASQIVDAAISQVSDLRGRLGAFEQNTLQTNINSLQVALENVTSSNSSIEDTDFAMETSNMTREEILVQAGTTVLAQANQTPSYILNLLK